MKKNLNREDGEVFDTRDRVRMICKNNHVWWASLGIAPPVFCFRCGGGLRHEWF